MMTKVNQYQINLRSKKEEEEERNHSLRLLDKRLAIWTVKGKNRGCEMVDHLLWGERLQRDDAAG